MSTWCKITKYCKIRQCMIKKCKNVFQVHDYLYECMNEKWIEFKVHDWKVHDWKVHDWKVHDCKVHDYKVHDW